MPEIRVPSDVNGRICQLEVAVGDEVAAGDTLLVLESMKMELPLEAPSGGRVKQILAAVGGVVEEGEILVVIEA